MPNAALQHGVLEFEFKAAGGADTTLGRKSAAEHGATIRQSLNPEAALNQFCDREHGIERAFLVQHALAADPCMRSQDHLIPVTDDLLEFPQHRRDRLVAHLL